MDFNQIFGRASASKFEKLRRTRLAERGSHITKYEIQTVVRSVNFNVRTFWEAKGEKDSCIKDDLREIGYERVM
jgi:hypothetical protein